MKVLSHIECPLSIGDLIYFEKNDSFTGKFPAIVINTYGLRQGRDKTYFIGSITVIVENEITGANIYYNIISKDIRISLVANSSYIGNERIVDIVKL